MNDITVEEIDEALQELLEMGELFRVWSDEEDDWMYYSKNQLN